MSVEAMATVLNHSKAKGTAKLILLGIANHEGDGGAWPSIATLARYGGCTEPQVRRLCRSLVELKELAIEFNEGGMRGSDPRYRPNRYHVLVTCPPTCDGSLTHRDSDRAPTHPLKDPGRAARPIQGARGGSPGRAPTRAEPSLELSIEPPLKEGARAAQRSPRKSTAATKRSEPRTIGDSRALLLATEVWEAADPKPALGFAQVRSVARKLVAVRPESIHELAKAMLAAPTITVAAVEIVLNGRGPRRNGSRAEPTAEDWAATEREALAREATTTKGKR